MSILHVASLGQPVLRQRARALKDKDILELRTQMFVDDLVESMRFHDGVGLAAPQVFQSLRVIAIEVPPDLDPEGQGIAPTVYINPELTPTDDRMESNWEGCLSLKDLRGIVPRHCAVRFRALDRDGKRIDQIVTGFAARVLQHEVDHLDGIVFLDRMEDLASLGFARDLACAADTESSSDASDE